MALFAYKGINSSNEVVQATVPANSKDEVAQNLTKQGITPISITILQEKKQNGSLPIVEKITFCRYISAMLKSGLSITESIAVLSEEVTHPMLRKIIIDLDYGIQHGQSISTIFARYPQSFSEFFVTLIKAGEISGTLADTFGHIEEEIRSEHSLSQKIVGAMMYPAVVFLAMIGIGVMMFFFILPQIGKVFLNLKLPLALPTRLMFEASLALNNFKWLILGGGALLFVGMAVFLTTPTGKRLFFKLIAPIPVVKNLVKQIDMARFCRIFSTLLASGVPITQALEISLDSLSYTKFKQFAPLIIKDVTQGKTVSTAFKTHKIFPPLLTQMIASGEKSGTLDTTLKDLGVFYEEEVENAVKKATQLLEPILILLVGIGVGIMVLSIVIPIYSVVSNIQAGSGQVTP